MAGINSSPFPIPWHVLFQQSETLPRHVPMPAIPAKAGTHSPTTRNVNDCNRCAVAPGFRRDDDASMFHESDLWMDGVAVTFPIDA